MMPSFRPGGWSSVRFFLAVLASPVVTAAPAASSANTWGLEPLGPVVPPTPLPKPPLKRHAEPGSQKLPVSGGDVRLVSGGKAAAIIVIPAQATEIDTWGAAQIQTLLEKMSGARLAIVRDDAIEVEPGGGRYRVRSGGESANALFVGKVRQSVGVIDVDQLPDEGFRIKTTNGSAVFIIGQEKSRWQYPTEGTRFGVTAFMEEKLGWRWLWPGSLGEVFEQKKDITVPASDEIDAPALIQRKLRDTGYRISDRIESGLRRLGFTAAEFEQKTASFREWLAFQRLGTSVHMSGGHSYEGWWDKYGAQHPDWFGMQPNGSRTQKPPREVLEFVNPELAAEVARVRSEELRNSPTLYSVSISPNDGSSQNCVSMSTEARKADSPSGETIFLYFVIDGKRAYKKYVSLTDRHVLFFNRVAEQVAREHPNRYVSAYAYGGYRDAPVYMKVHPNVIIGYVGFDYTNEYRLNKDRNNWTRWSTAANRMFFRPNLFYAGSGYPVNYGKRLADDLRMMYDSGMFGMDVSSIHGHWAANGLMYYVVPRLMWNPTADIDALIRDYCRKGFGPAARKVEDYFAHIEALTRKVAQRTGRQNEEEMRAEERESIQSGDLFMKVAPEIYTSADLQAGHRLLDAAKAAAGDDATVRARIEFLREGLNYAGFQSRIYGLRNSKSTKPAEMQAAFTEKYDHFDRTFRDHFYSIGVVFSTYSEGWVEKNNYGWKFPALKEGPKR